MKDNNIPRGNYYIRVRTTGWFLWYQFYENGVRHQERVDSKAARDLGFKPEMSVTDAKKLCTQINKERSLLKDKIRVAAKRVTSLKTLDEILFPQDRINKFQELLEEENFGSEQHLEKLNSHFNFIQKMCNELRILPIEYKQASKRIYKYFIKEKISPSYAARIVSFLNRWGKFASRISGNFYDEVPLPRGREKSAIADAQLTKSGVNTELGVRTESLPLTPAALFNAKDKLIPEQFNWLLLTIWFGLRPEEVELLNQPKRFRIEVNAKKKVNVLHIYQSKLQNIAEEKRWKAIPIIFPEQKNCLDIIQAKSFKRPLHKTVRKYVGNGITLYGGRKAFVDLMLSKGQKLEDISMWLGHKDISTTWQHYKDKEEINFTEVPQLAKLIAIK